VLEVMLLEGNQLGHINGSSGVVHNLVAVLALSPVFAIQVVLCF
jgi:hypothetical protein